MCLLERCDASESGCDNSPRIVSAFGAENNPGAQVSLATGIRSQLPGLYEVRRILDTKLAPSGEQIVIYDSSTDDSDPLPKVAFVVGGHTVKVFDGEALNPKGGGFERYLSSCEFDLTPKQRALAIVVSAGYDGAASAFAIMAWQSGEYRIVFHTRVGQGRMELGVLKFELWDMIWGKVTDRKRVDFGDPECVWCPHRYRITEYLWRDGKYFKAGSRETVKQFDPAEISGRSLELKLDTEKE
jgi:hypothetical protein